MTRRCRTVIAPMVVVGAIVGSIVASAAVAAPGLPPGFPPTGAIPGSATAKFTVVVEGTATAYRTFDGGATSPCLLSLRGDVRETTTYRRGKGVVMVFRRVGSGSRAPILVHRAGRRTDTSLAVKVRTTRVASGSASRADPPGAPVSVCMPLVEDLAVAPECAKPRVEDASVSLLYERRGALLSLRIDSSTLIGTAPPACPDSAIVPALESMRFSWPTPPSFDRMTMFLPPKDIFGPRRVLVGTVAPRPRKAPAETFDLGGVRYSATDGGTNRLTIRLIRVS